MAIKFLSGLNLSDVTAGSILKLDSNGNIVAATAGTDYATSNTWSAVGSNIYRNSDVRIGTYQSGVAPSARLHVFDYQTTDPKLLIEDGNTGDASMQFKISTQSYTMGIDNSDSDKFVLAASSALGTTNVLEISTAGGAAFQNGVLFNEDVTFANDVNFDASGYNFTISSDTTTRTTLAWRINSVDSWAFETDSTKGLSLKRNSLNTTGHFEISSPTRITNSLTVNTNSYTNTITTGHSGTLNLIDTKTLLLDDSFGTNDGRVFGVLQPAPFKPSDITLGDSAYSSSATGSYVTNNYPNVKAESDATGITNYTTFTFAEALAQAETLGGRLPTLEEVMSGVGRGSGQGYDNEYIWTQTKAGHGKYWVAKGSAVTTNDAIVVDINASTPPEHVMRIFYDISKDNMPVYYDNSSNIRATSIKAENADGIALRALDGDIGITIKDDATVKLNQYTAGLLKTDASGNISLDTSTYLTSVSVDWSDIGSINGTINVNSTTQIGEGDTETLVSFQNSGTERGSFQVDSSANSYFVATGFKTTGSSTGLLKSDGTIDTSTYATTADINSFIEITDVATYLSTNNYITTGYTGFDSRYVLSTGGYYDEDFTWDGTHDFSNVIKVSGAAATTTNTTALFYGANGVIEKRDLGSNAFNSTSYLTSYTETDTLDSVTGRGATTTNNISVGNLTAVGGTFTDPVTIYDSTTTENPRLSVGRNAGESIQFGVTDVVNTITAKQDSDSDGDHTFVLDRVFAGAGDSIFSIHNDGTPDLTIDGSGVVSFNQYNTAGILKVNTSGAISVDTSSYLTSYTETSTLDNVADRGATTNQALTLGSSATSGGRILSANYTGSNRLGVISSEYSSGDLLLGYGAEGKNGSAGFVSTYGNFSGAHSVLQIASSSIDWRVDTSNSQTEIGGELTLESQFAVSRTGILTMGDGFTSTKGNTAYGWGDHSSEGYLTSYTETDTLSSVVSRGASTTTAITTGGITATYGHFGGTSTAPQVRIYTENASASIADTFADTSTDKSYIYFMAGTNSNDPGYIMHETSESASPDERNEGVLHLVPSDDNSTGDYVSIHGTNDADVLKLHTSGLIETATGYQLVLKSGNASVKVDDTLHVTGRLYVDTLDANTSSTSALVEGTSGEIEKRTLGSAAFSTATDFVAVGGDTVTGQITFPTAIGNRPVFGEGIIARSDQSDTDGTHDIWGISERYYPSNSTAADAWGIQWSGTPNEINFIGAGQKKLSIDLDTAGTVKIDGNAVATESYVTTQISNLVDSAPAALDTLNELAAALGDDASFSTTMSTALGNRLRIDVNNQSLSSTELSNARTNLGLGTAATSDATSFVAVSGDTMTGTLSLDNADSLSFESGKHWITYNDGEGNFNIRVGHKSDSTLNEISTETGYAFHDEWSQSSGWREFNVSGTSITAGNDVGTWRRQMYYDYNDVQLAYQGSVKFQTTNVGVTITGEITTTAGNSSNWNTAYTYSQVGHLPLAGGTMSGALTISAAANAAWLASFTNTSASGHGLIIQAGGTTGTRYITQWKDAAGTERFHMDDTGEAYFQNRIQATGGIDGLTLANGGISGTNFNITGVNQLEIADPGEGIVFKSGSSGDMTLAIVDDTNDNILRFSGTNAVFDVAGDLSSTNLTIAESIIHEGDADTKISFTTDVININTGGGIRASISNSTSKFNNDVVVIGGETLSLGERAEGDDLGRTVLIEGVANAANGEGSGRIFFTEHNSTTAAADSYGLSLYYEGDPNAQLPSGFQPNTGNATWSLRRHDNSVNGVAIMSGTRSSSDVTFSGSISATSKSFDIEHPTKEGKRLVYGSLEGAEHGVYFRGKGTGEVIELPEHWTGLVHEDSITVQLTPIGKNCVWVEDIKDNAIHVGMDNDTPYFYFIQGERKDIDKLIVEQDA